MKGAVELFAVIWLFMVYCIGLLVMFVIAGNKQKGQCDGQ